MREPIESWQSGVILTLYLRAEGRPPGHYIAKAMRQGKELPFAQGDEHVRQLAGKLAEK